MSCLIQDNVFQRNFGGSESKFTEDPQCGKYAQYVRTLGYRDSRSAAVAHHHHNLRYPDSNAKKNVAARPVCLVGHF